MKFKTSSVIGFIYLSKETSNNTRNAILIIISSPELKSQGRLSTCLEDFRLLQNH